MKNRPNHRSDGSNILRRLEKCQLAWPRNKHFTTTSMSPKNSIAPSSFPYASQSFSWSDTARPYQLLIENTLVCGYSFFLQLFKLTQEIGTVRCFRIVLQNRCWSNFVEGDFPTIFLLEASVFRVLSVSLAILPILVRGTRKCSNISERWSIALFCHLDRVSEGSIRPWGSGCVFLPEFRNPRRPWPSDLSQYW